MRSIALFVFLICAFLTDYAQCETIKPGDGVGKISVGISKLNDVISKEPAHKLKIDQNKLQNCRSNILNLVNVL